MRRSVRRLVLDVLKLRDPPIPEFALRLGSIADVEDVKVSLVEMDQETESVKVTVEGEDINIDLIRELMRECKATVHSIDEVAAAKSVIGLKQHPLRLRSGRKLQGKVALAK